MQWCYWQYHGHHVMVVPKAWYDQKCYVTSQFDCLDLRNAMMSLMMLSTSHDAETGSYDVTWPKSHVVPHVHQYNLRNVMVPLMTPSAWCGASDNSITWSKNSCCTSFLLSWPKECSATNDDAVDVTCTNGVTWPKDHVEAHFDLKNAVVPLMMPLALHDISASATGIKWPKASCYTSFQLSGLRNAAVPLMMPLASIDAGAGSNDIMWPKKVILTFILIIFTKGIQWCHW